MLKWANELSIHSSVDLRGLGQWLLSADLIKIKAVVIISRATQYFINQFISIVLGEFEIDIFAEYSELNHFLYSSLNASMDFVSTNFLIFHLFLLIWTDIAVQYFIAVIMAIAIQFGILEFDFDR